MKNVEWVALLECRGCGSTRTRAELDAGGWVNCCPERTMNEVIEQRYGTPALIEARCHLLAGPKDKT